MFQVLDNGKPVRSLSFTPEEANIVKLLPLITAKPLIFVCNTDAESFAKGECEIAKKF